MRNFILNLMIYDIMILGVSTMQRLMSNDVNHPFKLLNVQYRMHPEISVFPNNTFYKGFLRDSESVLSRPSPAHVLKNHNQHTKWIERYLFVNVRKGIEERERGDSGSFRNVEEAESICKVISSCLLTSDCMPSMSIVVLSFYSAQVRYIKTALQRTGIISSCNCSVQAMTVDSFQGSEADIVLISFVRSNRDNTVGFLKDFQRLNVALTRAKHILLLFGSTATVEHCGLSTLRDLVVDARTRRRLIDFPKNNLMYSRLK